MKSRLIVLLLLLAASLGYGVYLFCFKTLDNDDIAAYGWKGGACVSLPSVLDFRTPRMRLQGDFLYIWNIPWGRIVERNYRAYASDDRLTILSASGELCPFWNKWENRKQ